jgi:hypothetical protein
MSAALCFLSGFLPASLASVAAVIVGQPDRINLVCLRGSLDESGGKSFKRIKFHLADHLLPTDLVWDAPDRLYRCRSMHADVPGVWQHRT